MRFPLLLRALAPLVFLSGTVSVLPVSADEPVAAADNAPPLTSSMIPVTLYKFAHVDGTKIFYREAGPTNAPVVLLLQGFPTSSHMFRNLIPFLADRYHVIAPDYPGFGFSDAPDHTTFAYTFDHFASLMDGLLDQAGVKRYSVYIFDYGAPVGFRLALMHPDRISSLIVQNGNAYAEGLSSFWDPMRTDWKNDTHANREALSFLVTPETTKAQYLYGVKDPTRVDPDNWNHDQPLLDRPGNKAIQLDLFHDYGSNLRLYPKVQAYFRKYEPPTLIVWGQNDIVFPPNGARAYLSDLPHAEIHLVDSGHYVLEDKADEVFPLIRGFLDRKLISE